MSSTDREAVLPGLEVSCRPIGFFFRELERQGHPPDLLLEGLEYSRERLTDKHARIDWDSYRRLMANLGRVWDADALVRAGKTMVTSRWTQPFGSIARLLLSCEETYRWTMDARYGVSRQQLTCIDNDLKKVGPHRIEIRTTMVPGYDPSPELFQLFVGSLAGIPHLLGLRDAKVVMRKTERGADFSVDLPVEGKILTRIRRLIAWPFHSRAAARELKETSEQLFERSGQLIRESHSRANAEAALQESQNRFYKAFRAAPALMAISARDGQILDLNDALANACGYPRDELIGRNVHEFGFWSNPEQRARIVERLQSGEPARAVETEFRTRRGETRYGLVSVEEVTVDGEPCVVFQAVDITDRKRAEKRNRVLQERMMHAQKLESLGVMAGGIAHDFNNILVGILGNAEVALVNLDEGPIRTHVEKILTASKQAADLTREMLAYAGKGKIDSAPVSLADAVRETVTLVGSGLTAKNRIVLNVENDGVCVDGDETQIRQVVMNLITNAAESYGDGGGVVDVRVGVFEPDSAWLAGPYFGKEQGPGAHALVEVRDRGSGMDPETLNRIFDPFFTTKFTGRGLGLAATLGIVKGHEGALKVLSTHGEGTVFQLLMPLGAAVRKVSAPSSAAEEPIQGEGSILVVDDEQTVRDVMREMLELAGYHATCATGGEEAVELVRRTPTKFVAVVLDLTMPELSGEETFQALRLIREDLPVICCSGYGDEVGVQWIEGRSHVRFLAKPFTTDSLLMRLGDVLSEHDTPPPKGSGIA